MKKIGVLLVLLLLFSVTFVYAQDNNIEEFAEFAGEGLLKVQEFLFGAMSFVSLGTFDGGTFGFVQFLLMTVLFMLLYSIVTLMPFVSDNLQLPFAVVISILAFMFIDTDAITTLLTNYEVLGIVLTAVLPVLVLLAFTFRIYQRAYRGKGNKSPFYAEMFNLVFLVFFGIFFIRYSRLEEGAIALMRFWSGWVLIGLGIAQTLLYKLMARLWGQWGHDSKQFAKDMTKMKREYTEKKREIELS